MHLFVQRFVGELVHRRQGSGEIGQGLEPLALTFEGGGFLPRRIHSLGSPFKLGRCFVQVLG
jgi:hypothetical protein